MGGYVNRTKIAQLYADAESLGGQTVTVAGWVKSVRDMKNFGFVTLNDGSCFRDLQVVMNREALDNYDEIAHQNVSAALICTGTVKLTPDAPQPFELSATSIEVEGVSAPDYPLQKKRATVEFLRTQQHLRPRTNLFRAVFRIRSVEVDWIQDFFGKHASLTVSGQLNAENFAMAFGDVYTFGPTFRAENSNTTRHAAEFWMIEPEMAFADLNDYMDNAEAMLKYVLKDVMATCPDELNMLNKFVDKGLLERLDHVANSDFARVTYTEAVEILEQAVAAGHQFDYPVSWGIDLQTEHERFLTEEHFKRPTFVTDYPAEIKAFYMRMNEDGKTVAAADCLVPGIGEIIGGSQREERLDLLEARIKDLGMNPEQYKYYLDLRRYGSCKHAGYGLGFERLVMYLTGVGNIRDVLPHPRTVGNADF